MRSSSRPTAFCSLPRSPRIASTFLPTKVPVDAFDSLGCVFTGLAATAGIVEIGPAPRGVFEQILERMLGGAE